MVMVTAVVVYVCVRACVCVCVPDLPQESTIALGSQQRGP